MAIVVVLQCWCGACERAWPPRRPWEFGTGWTYPIAETKGGETYPMAEAKGGEAYPMAGTKWDEPILEATTQQPKTLQMVTHVHP